MINLAKFNTVAACNSGAEIQLKDPYTGEPIEAFITVRGKDSDAFQQVIRDRVNGELRKQALRKKTAIPEIMTVEKSEEDAIDLLVMCTVGWRSGSEQSFTFDDEVLPFSIKNAKRVYTEWPWIRRQIDEAIADLENFMPT